MIWKIYAGAVECVLCFFGILALIYIWKKHHNDTKQYWLLCTRNRLGLSIVLMYFYD